ncbi:MAG: recombination mediator RecR [Spirochaetaceae bacterium]|jgi:recombination protein RecR|nr:recombination mediator RecR [Spirochaetaceae bacterium]GMO23749.1 MAG: recombination mediator RecR [Termitinemataceae bacterium]
MNAIDSLVAALARLPGIGKKSAARLAYHILEETPDFAGQLAAQLSGLHSAIKRCSICGSWTETEPCAVCVDPGRDSGQICVVERSQDVRVIEESREFRGRFHVLGGLIAPLDGVMPGDLAIESLLSRVRQGGVREVILALNPTLEGDTTALYIQKALSGTGVLVSRLASGLPVGGDLEYADRLTLARSLRGRVSMENAATS